MIIIVIITPTNNNFCYMESFILVSSNMPSTHTGTCKECCLGPNYFVAIPANRSRRMGQMQAKLERH